MKIELTEKKECEARFLRVSANVRRWSGAEINGKIDESGSKVPFRCGDFWAPVIDIDNGTVVAWPDDMVAKFYFKICDTGSYYLLDKNMDILASIDNNYVPNGLCHGDIGYGDYIIFNVGGDGKIEKYTNLVDPDDWVDEED